MFLLGLFDGAFVFLLQLLHALHGGRVLGRRLLVHQLAPGLGVLGLHHLQGSAVRSAVGSAGSAPCVCVCVRAC